MEVDRKCSRAALDGHEAGGGRIGEFVRERPLVLERAIPEGREQPDGARDVGAADQQIKVGERAEARIAVERLAERRALERHHRDGRAVEGGEQRAELLHAEEVLAAECEPGRSEPGDDRLRQWQLARDRVEERAKAGPLSRVDDASPIDRRALELPGRCVLEIGASRGGERLRRDGSIPRRRPPQARRPA